MEINTNLLEPASAVANKLIDKIADACGFFVTPRGLKKVQQDAWEQHVNNVILDNTLTRLEKEEFIRSIPLLNKQNLNRKKVIDVACDNLEKDASPDDIDDNWLMDYLDKIKNIASKDAQLMWGKLLASEANHPGTISKRLVQNIYLMDQRDAWQFTMFTAFCFYDACNELAHPIVYLRKMPRLYHQTFLTTQYVYNLQNWGLIECNYDPGFVFISKKDLIYMGSQYTLLASKLGDSIDAGNIKFTKDGQSLFNIVEKQNDSSVLDKTLEAFSNLGIKHEISGRKGVWSSDTFQEYYRL